MGLSASVLLSGKEMALKSHVAFGQNRGKLYDTVIAEIEIYAIVLLFSLTDQVFAQVTEGFKVKHSAPTMCKK